MTTWLTLKEAAKLLEVHPSTIRRWANDGAIPVLVTPGGHRRFAEEDIKAFQNRRHGRRPRQSLEEVWSEQALTRTRRELGTTDDPAWMDHIDEVGRTAHRQLGRRLMGLTLQYLAGPDEAERFLAEAKEIGEAYGRLSLSQGMALADALEAMLFFRDTLLEVALELPSSMRTRAEATVQLIRRLNTLLNEVHLAIARIYQNAADQ